MKFAYLIIAHTRFNQVLKLLQLLDDTNNDIYVHIDKKVSNALDIFQNVLKPSMQKSSIYFVNQHSVVWGGRVKLRQSWSF